MSTCHEFSVLVPWRGFFPPLGLPGDGICWRWIVVQWWVQMLLLQSLKTTTLRWGTTLFQLTFSLLHDWWETCWIFLTTRHCIVTFSVCDCCIYFYFIVLTKDLDLHTKYKMPSCFILHVCVFFWVKNEFYLYVKVCIAVVDLGKFSIFSVAWSCCAAA